MDHFEQENETAATKEEKKRTWHEPKIEQRRISEDVEGGGGVGVDASLQT